MHVHDLVFFLAAFFICGIAFGSLGLGLLISLLFMFAFSIFVSYEKNIKFSILFVFSGILGIFYFTAYTTYKSLNIPLQKTVLFSGVVTSDPDYKEKFQRFDFELSGSYKGKVRIYADRYPTFRYGDFLELYGEIEQSPSHVYVSSFPNVQLIERDKGSRLKAFLIGLKNSLVNNLRFVFPPDKAALASGMLLGEREEFSDDFKDAMSKSGTSHITALSGYNISIIAGALSSALGFFMRRSTVLYISVLVIVLFVLMTGAEASIIRAAIMGILLLIAERSGRLYGLRNVITIAALLMLLFEPTLLVFDVGFQLSFAAFLGIAFIKPLFERFLALDVEKWRLGWRKVFMETISAQIGVFPLLLSSFGYVSPFGVVANVLLLQLIPITMFLSFFTAAFGFVSYNLSLVLGWFAGILLGYEISIINFFSFGWL